MASSVRSLGDGKIEISTPHLLLRAAVEDDAVPLNEPFSDPEVMRYWSEPPHKDQARTNEWVNKFSASPQNGVTDFVICLKPDLTPIGKIGVWQDEEIGFLLTRSRWGKGFAQEAMRAILPYLFDEKGFHELTADIDPRNVASDGLLQKMGFEKYDFKEKNFLMGDEWVDSQYLKLTKERFHARK